MPSIVLQIFFALLLLCCAYSACFGGKEARIAVGMMVVAVLATRIVTWMFITLWPLTIVDIALFLGFLTLSLRSERYWPLWVTGLHGVSIAAHIVALVGPPIPYRVYHGIMGVWSIPVMIMMTLGIMLDQHEGKNRGFRKSP